MNIEIKNFHTILANGVIDCHGPVLTLLTKDKQEIKIGIGQAIKDDKPVITAVDLNTGVMVFSEECLGCLIEQVIDVVTFTNKEKLIKANMDFLKQINRNPINSI